jgi:hypothetical protein
MHWENIQKRAQKRSNVIFRNGQGFSRFFCFDALGSVLSAFPGLCYGNPRLTAFRSPETRMSCLTRCDSAVQ